MSVQRVRDDQIKITNLPEGRLTNVSGSVGAIRENLAAVAAPTGSDNFASGYAIGSLWLYSGIWYVCSGDGSWMQFYPATVSSISSDNVTNESVVNGGAGSISDALDSIGSANEAELQYAVLGGTVNGVNTSFTVPQALDSGDIITWNGVALTGGGVDYTATGTAIAMDFAPPTGSVMEVRYLTGTGVIPASVVAAIAASAPVTAVVSLDFGTLGVKSKKFTVTVTGATVGRVVTMTADPETLGDELEMDGFTCAAWVSATNTVEAYIHAIPGPVSGTRDFNVVIN